MDSPGRGSAARHVLRAETKSSAQSDLGETFRKGKRV